MKVMSVKSSKSPDPIKTNEEMHDNNQNFNQYISASFPENYSTMFKQHIDDKQSLES